jgi:hypothetical protein
MTTAADDFAVEEAFEAYLAGRPVADAGAGVASFAAAVRATATRPGRPNAALAELLATGLLVDQPVPSPRTAPSRRRRRLAMFFPALLAKLLSAGAVAQAATGAGIAVVVVTSAGAAGVLPGPIQETFSSIVGTETPETGSVDPTTLHPATTTEPTDAADPTQSDETETPATEAPATEAPATGTPATESPEVTGPDPSRPFGQWLNGRVEHGEVDGKRVSEWAHERNEQRRNGRVQDADRTSEAGDDTGSGQDDAAVQGGGNHRGNGKGGHGSR